jgi:hypothetical protein
VFQIPHGAIFTGSPHRPFRDGAAQVATGPGH